MILFFVLFSIVVLADKNYCSLINGVWKNELGSVATLKSDANGDLSGIYESAVGKVNGYYEVRGRVNLDCETYQTVSFSVAWINNNGTSHSSSAWAGILTNDTIYTTWLLVTSVRSLDDIWSSTHVGTNVFERQ